MKTKRSSSLGVEMRNRSSSYFSTTMFEHISMSIWKFSLNYFKILLADWAFLLLGLFWGL